MEELKPHICWNCANEFSRFKWHLCRFTGEVCAHCPFCDTNLAIKPEDYLKVSKGVNNAKH